VFLGAQGPDFGDRIEKSKYKFSKQLTIAKSFLEKKIQPFQSEDAPVALDTPCCFFDDNEEDLISFDSEPAATPTKPKADAATNVTVLHDAFMEDKTGANSKPFETVIADQFPTLKVEVDTVGLAKIPQKVEAAMKCFTCGSCCVDSLIACPCKHQYCSECLCQLVKSSIRDEIPFPPACCELLVPVNLNSAVFDSKTLRDFLSKKFGVGYETPDTSPRKRKIRVMPTPPQDKNLPDGQDMAVNMPKKGTGALCYLCKRVNERDACKLNHHHCITRT
jgi:hypothetical protein